MRRLNLSMIVMLFVLLVSSPTFGQTNSATAGNAFYEVFVDRSSGAYTVRTGPQHPAGPNISVLYDGDSGTPGTSFNTIRSYRTSASNSSVVSTDYVQAGDISGVALSTFSPVVSTFSPTGIRIVYTIDRPNEDSGLTDKLLITQDVEVVGSTFQTSAVQVRTRVENLALTSAKIAVRYLWDFEIGADDGPAFAQRNPNAPQVNTEAEYFNPAFSYFSIEDNDMNPSSPLLSVLGTANLANAFNPPAARPTLLKHACWPSISRTAFDYTINPQTLVNTTAATDCRSNAGGDGAVALYFGHDQNTALTVNPGGDLVDVSAYIFLELPAPTNTVDTDGDGLFDVWETTGIDFNNDGTVDAPTPAGLNQNRKDILIYYDWTAANEPQADSLERVKQAFANASVSNPDGTTGITVHFRAGKLVSEGDDRLLGTTVNGQYSWQEFATIKQTNFPANLWPYYHYVIFATAYDQPYGSSGISRNGSDFNAGSSDFLVTIGSWGRTGEDLIRVEAGTIMHELGHNLGLRHGGNDENNRKPNYLSIMNYSFQLIGLQTVDGTYRLDYSRFDSDDLPQLNEVNLNETMSVLGATLPTPTPTPTATEGAATSTPTAMPTATDTPSGTLPPNFSLSNYKTLLQCPSASANAIQASTDRNTVFSNESGYVLIPIALNGLVDWNCDNAFSAAPINTDINTDRTSEILNGFDDWSHLVFTGGAIGSLGAALDLPLTTDTRLNPEPNLESYEQMLEGYYVPDTERCLVDVSLAPELSDAINAANAGTGCLNIRLNADIPLGQLSPAYPGEYGDNAFPIITQNLQIDGNGFTISRVNATSDFRFFTISNRGGTPVTAGFTNITFSGGRVAQAGAVLADASNGGNITLNLDTVTFSGNDSLVGNGGALAAFSFRGGSSSVTITNSRFDNNTAGYGGGFYDGGFENGNGVATITNTTFANNRATIGGGAIYANAGSTGRATLNLTGSSFVNNQSSGSGGAIFSNGTSGGNSTITAATTTFANNQAPTGDAVFLDATGGNTSFSGETQGSSGMNTQICLNDDTSVLVEVPCAG